MHHIVRDHTILFIINRSSLLEVMPFTDNNELSKIPINLDLREYYSRIYNWFTKNRNKVYDLYKGTDLEYPKLSNKIVENLPSPNLATDEDIVFVCRMILASKFEWAYGQRDENNVLMPAYAQYILDNFFGKNNYAQHDELMKKCKLYILLKN